MKRLLLFLLAFLPLLAAAQTTVTVTPTVDTYVRMPKHPGMLHNLRDLSRVRIHLDQSPWREAYAHLCASSYAQTSYKDHTSALGSDGMLKRMDAKNWSATYVDYSNYTALMRDANAAYQLALRYQLSRDTQFADAATRILDAWVNNCKGILRDESGKYANNIPDPNLYLIEIQTYQLANAAELLRDYDGWSGFAKFQTWMKSTFYEVAHLFLDNHHNQKATMHYWLNWDLACLTAVLSIGILCDDQTLIDEAINYYKTNTAEVGYVRNAVPYLHDDPDSEEELGQCEESGRDQGHATLCVSLLGVFCQMAKNAGYDLFAYDDYRAVKMAEYVAKYNLVDQSGGFVYSNIPYTAYTNASYSCPTLSAEGRGTLRPCWDLFYGYAQQAGIAARYCQEWSDYFLRKNAWGDGGAGDYGSNSGGFDQLGYGTLMYRP